MLLGENISMAVGSLKTNKLRSFLTMLGIIIGIAAVIAIFTVGNSLQLSVSETMQSIGANDIYVQVVSRADDEDENASSDSSDVDGIQFAKRSTDADMTDSDYITDDMLQGLSDYMGNTIKAINVSKQAGSVDVRQGEHETKASLLGTSVGYFVTNSPSIQAGNFFSQQDFDDHRRVALVEQDLVDDMFDGDADAAIGQEIDVTVNDVRYPVTIIGVYKNDSQAGMMMFGMNQTTVYMPLGTVNEMLRSDGEYQSFQIIAAVGQTPADLSDRVEEYFTPYYRNNVNYKVTAVTFGSLLNMLYKLLGTITSAISLIAGIALLVGGIGVMNIMLVSVTERTREIGTRKALGARNSSIRMQFIVEAMIICLIGGIIGVILGILLGVAASNYLGYPARPSITGIVIALVFSMAIGLFFGYFPANKAAKMNPIDALRYE